jgi:hypothetical protein
MRSTKTAASDGLELHVREACRLHARPHVRAHLEAAALAVEVVVAAWDARGICGGSTDFLKQEIEGRIASEERLNFLKQENERRGPGANLGRARSAESA